MLTGREAARMIDISAVRTHNTRKEIEGLVAIAKEYRFINVHVLPAWVHMTADLLKNDPDILVGSPVGFPGGGHTTATKITEAVQLLNDGVGEMDIVMNVGRFLSGEGDYVERELRSIIEIVDHKVPTKVIIEINTMNDEEMLRAADIVIQSGADFVKTGTGWVPGGENANIERIRKLKDFCGDRIKVKAAGGIRTPEQFMTLADMGVERMGINTKSALEIVKALG